MVRANLLNLIEKAIKKAQKEKKLPKFEILEILIKKPENPRFGDYATNIAMQIARITKKKPMETANIIKSQIPNNSKFLEKVEVVKPGFINFFLSREFLQKQVKEILGQREKFGKLKNHIFNGIK